MATFHISNDEPSLTSMNPSQRIVALTMTLGVALQAAAHAESLALLPGQIVLHGPQSSQRLLVERQQDGRYVGESAQRADFQSDDTKVAIVKNGVVYPVGDGEATISATVEGKETSATVSVVGAGSADAWSFRHDVLPVLSKAGCNSGACHGALAGKGGFKLSLRGYDPIRDHFSITRHARGRRIEPSDPGRSLVLAKPSGALPHKGGLRFETDSPEYRLLAEWIAGGAAPPSGDDPELSELIVWPPQVQLAHGDQQQFLVQATYSDGRVKDVTGQVKFASADEAVATVDDSGKVTVVGPGEGAITAWYSSKIAIARVTSRFPNPAHEDAYAAFTPQNFIDEIVLTQLKRVGLPPSQAASDAVFLRRAYLDTIGVLPTAAEARRFLADRSSDKRAKLVDALLSRSEYVDYWSYYFSDVLLINGTRLRPGAVKAYYQWIRQHVESNTPWDKTVRELLTATGGSHEEGATNFYALHQSPEDMAENACQAFLSLSIGCAKCHNHPVEKWTNDQYYALANLFARVHAKGWGGDGRSGDGKRTVFVAARGDLVQPLTGQPQPPTPLDGEPIPLDVMGHRPQHSAHWLTSPDNPYFARAIANRVWANFFSVGIVDPVDDLRRSNPASNEQLLNALADFLAKNDFDLKALMRNILLSSAYSRSSLPLEGNRDEHRFYARYYPRRLKAEVLLDAISQVTRVPTDFNQIAFPGADAQKTDFYPSGTRALELYDSAVKSYFLKTFGRNPREITCDCERSNEPSMVQVLHLSNGDTILQKLQSENSRVSELLGSADPDYRLIEEVYLAALTRYPTDRELQALLQILQDSKGDTRRESVEDLFWSVLTSKEFLFNH